MRPGTPLGPFVGPLLQQVLSGTSFLAILLRCCLPLEVPWGPFAPQFAIKKGISFLTPSGTRFLEVWPRIWAPFLNIFGNFLANPGNSENKRFAL